MDYEGEDLLLAGAAMAGCRAAACSLQPVCADCVQWPKTAQQLSISDESALGVCITWRRAIQIDQSDYKFGKMKFPEFSKFSRPAKWLFPENYKEKTRCNELT